MYRETARKAHGNITISGPMGEIEADTRRCPHCGGHFVVGSGSLAEGRKALGSVARPHIYCQKCDRLTCGRPGCLECIPIEAQLDHAEGKRTRYDGLIEAKQ